MLPAPKGGSRAEKWWNLTGEIATLQCCPPRRAGVGAPPGALGTVAETAATSSTPRCAPPHHPPPFILWAPLRVTPWVSSASWGSAARLTARTESSDAECMPNLHNGRSALWQRRSGTNELEGGHVVALTQRDDNDRVHPMMDNLPQAQPHVAKLCVGQVAHEDRVLKATAETNHDLRYRAQAPVLPDVVGDQVTDSSGHTGYLVVSAW